MAANVTDIRNLIDLDLFDQSKHTVENFQTQQQQHYYRTPMQQPPETTSIEHYDQDQDQDQDNSGNNHGCHCDGMCCKQISHHVNDCDICKQIYSNDKTVYIVIIAILLVIIALLSKKAFNL